MADKTFRIRATAADGAPNEGVDIKLVDIGGSTYAIAAQGGTGASSTTVQGTAADGAAVAGNPVRIGGKDGAGNTQDLMTDTSGNLSVGSGTAGTAAANVVTVQGIASATPVIVGGAVASGAADSGNPVKVGGKYNATLPTLADGQRGDLQQGARGSVHTELYLSDSASPVGGGTSNSDGSSNNYASLFSTAYLKSFNGTTWDRIRSGVVTPTATLTGHQNQLPWAVYNVTPTTRTEGQGGPLQADTLGNLHVGGSVSSGATDTGNPVKVGGVYNGTPAALTNGQRGDMQLGVRGALKVEVWGNDSLVPVALATPADAMSNSGGGLRVNAFGAVFNGTTWDRESNATTTSRIVSAAADTNATVAKASAGTIHAIECYNAAAAVRYLKIYNKATAPVVGTDTPVRTIALKPTDRTFITFPRGRYFSAGIAYALTTGAADADTGALTAADVVGLNIDYS